MTRLGGVTGINDEQPPKPLNKMTHAVGLPKRLKAWDADTSWCVQPASLASPVRSSLGHAVALQPPEQNYLRCGIAELLKSAEQNAGASWCVPAASLVRSSLGHAVPSQRHEQNDPRCGIASV
ncbi:hypothetical protein NDU88_006289 [Pleurodeles waltl]|uniref:Uncharacterized protein n=1 Tax=Pleurodeles waltl TaxID=8319 RepID=A0AAV7QKE7_PLEWA|nr:hypothetical protein NDU88_006289 [Pleurodeles waltl]